MKGVEKMIIGECDVYVRVMIVMMDGQCGGGDGGKGGSVVIFMFCKKMKEFFFNIQCEGLFKCCDFFIWWMLIMWFFMFIIDV